MSVYYYLYCVKHKQAVFLTDTKMNPFDAVEMRYFYRHHLLDGCKVRAINEYAIDRIDGITLITSDPDSAGVNCILVTGED